MSLIGKFFGKNKYQKKLAIYRKIYWIFKKNKYGNLGKGSFLINPMFLAGTRYMYFQDQVEIWNAARIEAIDSWNEQKFHPVLKVGKNVKIGQNCHITLAESIEIENDVVLSGRVTVTDISHVTDDKTVPVLSQGLKTAPVKICEGAFVGINAVILPGVTIGKYAVVGSNSVVTKNVPPYTTVVGAPAKIIRKDKG